MAVLSGVTQNGFGDPLGNCDVYLFAYTVATRTFTQADHGVSDINGNYALTGPDSDPKYLVLAFKGPTPVVAGLTQRTLGPAAPHALNASVLVAAAPRFGTPTMTVSDPGATLLNTVAPALTGVTEQGATLHGTTGTWTGTAPITYAYQWCQAVVDGNGDTLVDANGDPIGVAIDGATAWDYALQASDLTEKIFCIVTATNPSGSVDAHSNVVGPITVGGGVAPTLTALTGSGDNTPDFQIDGDIEVGDAVRIQYATQANFSDALAAVTIVDAADMASNTLDLDIDPLPNAAYFFRSRIEPAGTVPTDWSNTVALTIAA